MAVKPTRRLVRRLRKLWTEALRSGEYQQGQSALCRVTSNQEEYCCLGVAFDVLVKEFPDEFKWETSYYDSPLRTAVNRSVDADSDNSVLPTTVLPFFGLDHEKQDGLVNRNDTYSNDFEAIAHKVESGHYAVSEAESKRYNAEAY